MKHKIIGFGVLVTWDVASKIPLINGVSTFTDQIEDLTLSPKQVNEICNELDKLSGKIRGHEITIEGKNSR